MRVKGWDGGTQWEGGLALLAVGRKRGTGPPYPWLQLLVYHLCRGEELQPPPPPPPPQQQLLLPLLQQPQLPQLPLPPLVSIPWAPRAGWERERAQQRGKPALGLLALAHSTPNAPCAWPSQRQHQHQHQNQHQQ